MSRVLVYFFEGTYYGCAEYEYPAPEIGGVHKCLLFMMQNDEATDISSVLQECRRFGFDGVTDLKAAPLVVESINSDHGRKFAPYYEEAVANGSSLVWYPNA